MIPAKTAAGQRVLKDRSAADLTARQRTALILIDGRRSLAEVLAAGTRPEDVERLFDLELIATATAAGPATASGLATAQPATYGASSSPQERYALAYPIAARLTAGLGLRGFRLNLAVEAATCYEDLLGLAARIREAVGSEKFTPLATALGQR